LHNHFSKGKAELKADLEAEALQEALALCRKRRAPEAPEAEVLRVEAEAEA
jgi:hypothetical protein